MYIKTVLTFLISAISSVAMCQTFTIRITPEAGFEAIDTIYEEFNSQQAQSILTVLNEHPPIDVDYLIQIRPFGNRLELMVANPDWSAAQLARIMRITFPYPVDVTAVKENFDNHPSLEVVSYDYNIDPVNFTPENPDDNHSTVIDLAFMPFYDCQGPALNSQNKSYDVEVSGNTINLLRVGANPRPPSTSICGLQATEMMPYDLGAIPAGNYVVNIYNVFQSTEFPAPAIERYLMGQTNLVVRGTEPVSVPAFSVWAIVLLAFSLMLMPILSLHHLKKYKY